MVGFYGIIKPNQTNQLTRGDPGDVVANLVDIDVKKLEIQFPFGLVPLGKV